MLFSVRGLPTSVYGLTERRIGPMLVCGGDERGRFELVIN
jgi:hypothetical protein